VVPIIPTQGKHGLMAATLSAIMLGANTSRVHLFTNPYTPDLTTTPASFTEAAFAGYAPIALPLAIDHGIDGSGDDDWYFNSIAWTASGGGLPETIYGYWIDYVNPVTSALSILWCQRFDTPFAFIHAGDTLPLILTIGGTQGT